MSKEKTITVICKDRTLYGSKINLPISGEVAISEEGEVELSEEVAEMLTEGSPSWSLKVAKVKEVVKTKPEVEDEASTQAEDEVEEEEEDLTAEIKESLNKLTLQELVEMAKTAKYPAEDYKKYKTNKKLMVAFLVKKATEEDK